MVRHVEARLATLQENRMNSTDYLATIHLHWWKSITAWPSYSKHCHFHHYVQPSGYFIHPQLSRYKMTTSKTSSCTQCKPLSFDKLFKSPSLVKQILSRRKSANGSMLADSDYSDFVLWRSDHAAEFCFSEDGCATRAAVTVSKFGLLKSTAWE